ncbi:MAG TPA: hypothetical protein VM183_20150 [Burkholderiales bacterium]|nr:hypothetical protein [Burkholderiales bacterium]
MPRRHLFDNGYPVCSATLVAGSEVLLALARRSLVLSRDRFAATSILFEKSTRSLAQSNALCRYTRLLTDATRPKTHRGIEAAPDAQPRERAARPAPHQL